MPVTAISAYSSGAETADIGRDNGGAVTPAYVAPFAITNASVEKLTILLDPPARP